MKVWHKYGIGAFSGTIDLGVFRPVKRRIASIMRRWVEPRSTEQNSIFGAIGHNLAIVYHDADGGYIQDLGVYAQRYYDEIEVDKEFDPTKSRYGIFVKMMYNWQKSDPEFVDLSAVTKEDIITHESPVLTVKDAVEAGLLPVVTDYEELDTPMGLPELPPGS